MACCRVWKRAVLKAGKKAVRRVVQKAFLLDSQKAVLRGVMRSV